MGFSFFEKPNISNKKSYITDTIHYYANTIRKSKKKISEMNPRYSKTSPLFIQYNTTSGINKQRILKGIPLPWMYTSLPQTHKQINGIPMKRDTKKKQTALFHKLLHKKSDIFFCVCVLV